MKQKWITLFSSRSGIILAGAMIGILAGLLSWLGNPPNMGICVACFERDLAGALGLHRVVVVQYLRPEIPALALGSFFAALLFGEFRPRAGSAPFVRFVLGAFAMIGALVFLGCPWRALLRLAGGDLNAVLGIAGLSVGIAIGAQFLKRGFSLGRAYPTKKTSGYLFPGLMTVLIIAAAIQPDFLFASEKGPGAMRAPVLISLAAGVVLGFLAQRSRFCTMGAFRDLILLRDGHLMIGVVALVVAAAAVNLALGKFNPGLAGQPVAHSATVWNILGMVLAGWCFAFGGACPGRQLFLSGEGDGDAAVFVIGMIVGGGLAHNFALAAKPDKLVDAAVQVGGPGVNGQVAVIAGLIFCLIIGFAMREKFSAE